MPITYSVNDNGNSLNTASPVSSGSIALTAGQVIVLAVVLSDSNPAGTLSISDNVGGMTYTLIQDASAAGACRVAAWVAVAPNGSARNISVSWRSGNTLAWSMFWMIHTDANTTTPIGASSKGTGANSVSYTITPSSPGSALWMIAADANGTGTQTLTPGTNCTTVMEHHPGGFSAIHIRPTTQPRTDSNAFTLAETHTGSGVSWVGFEVQAAGAAQSQAPRSLHQYSMRHAA